MITAPKPGVYRDVPFADYLAWDAVSSTYLRELVKCAALAKHKRDVGIDTAALIFGRAGHAYVLEPRTWPKHYAKASTKTTTGKRTDDGLYLIGVNDIERMESMYAALQKHGAAESLRGDIEVSIVWADPVTGVTCKARPDVVGDGFLADYKTTRVHPDEDAWIREMKTYGYHSQASMYRTGWHRATGDLLPFRFVPQGKSAPYLPAVYELGEADPWLDSGEKIWRKGLEIHAVCTASGEWPGYPGTPQRLGCPPWVIEEADTIERAPIHVGF